VSFGEDALGFFGIFLLVNPFGRLEHLIYETLESVVVSGLVLFLGVENADVIQEAFKFTQPGLVLLVASWLFHHVNGSAFLFLSWLLDELGWSVWLDSFSFFCSIVSRVASSASAYLLAMVNIASRWVPESLLEEHNNRLVVDHQDDISLVAESLDKLLEGLSLLLDDAG
jgi:hypothetical protein